jgi:Spy/CpxP family protein refolding chaperone
MKRTFLTALIICASVCTAFSQASKTQVSSDVPVTKEADPKAVEVKKAQEWQALLVTELKLTDEQVKKIAELNKAFSERAQSMESNTTATEEMKAERRVMMKKAQEAQFLKLLTPEQQARYKELLEARK